MDTIEHDEQESLLWQAKYGSAVRERGVLNGTKQNPSPPQAGEIKTIAVYSGSSLYNQLHLPSGNLSNQFICGKEYNSFRLIFLYPEFLRDMHLNLILGVHRH